MPEPLLPADPMPDTDRVAAVLGFCENERAASHIALHFEPAAWRDQVVAFMRLGWIEHDEQFVAGNRDAWMTARKARHRAEAEDAQRRRAADPRRRVEHDEHTAAFVQRNAREVERRGGYAALPMHGRSARLQMRARLGRARLALGRLLTASARPRQREHRATRRRTRSAARSASRGDPAPGPEPPPDGGAAVNSFGTSLIGGRARAILRFAFDNGGVTRDDLTAIFERGRGWKRREVNRALAELRDVGMLDEREPGLFVATANPGTRT